MGLGAFAACLAMLFGAREARAEDGAWEVGANLDLAVPLAAAGQRFLSTGAGFDVLAGYRFYIPRQHFSLTPEIAAGYTDIASHVVRVRPGFRIAYGRVFMPYVFGHVGWSWTTLDPMGPTDKNPEANTVTAKGASFDFGAGLDLSVFRRVTVGAHVGYNVVRLGEVDDSPALRAAPLSSPWGRWMSFGLNATLLL